MQHESLRSNVPGYALNLLPRKQQLWQPNFSKDLPKLSFLLDYKRPGMLCLALLPRHEVPKLDFQIEFSMSKTIQIFLIFFSLKNENLGEHFLLKSFLVTSILKPLQMVKKCLIFEQAAKLGKASRDGYNLGLVLIL